MRTVRCLEISGTNYHWTRSHLAEERNPHLRRGKNLIILIGSYVYPLNAGPRTLYGSLDPPIKPAPVCRAVVNAFKRNTN
jgi:hypothetical protein